MRILDAEQMRAVDRRAIEELGIPSMVLMENAALAVADAIGECYSDVASVAILCGPGNNGGDGLAVGRHLAVRGYRPHLFLCLGAGRGLEGDAARQLEICRNMNLPLWELDPDGEGLPTVVAELARADLLVDALFGTGLSRPLAGGWAELVEAVNRLDAPCLAVDLPSGLAGSNADLPGPSVRAERTVTFAAPKVPHVFPPAAEQIGELVVSDLGVPPSLVDQVGGARRFLMTAEEAADLLPPARRRAQHKGSFGHVLIVAGGPGGAGAGVLAARAAGRCGSGLVTLAVPACLATAADAAVAEAMVTALPEAAPGVLAVEAADRLLELCEGKDALALGPGLGRSASAEAVIREVALAAPLPLVLDADGLNAFAGAVAGLVARRAPTILTPHPAEMGRLLGTTTGQVQADRPSAVVRAASAAGAVALLKGHLTLVADPDGAIWVNPTGNPGMATGGSGDVLTGMIAALVAQGSDPRAAASAAAYLHGLAGDLAASRLGEAALLAPDLLDELPLAHRELSQHRA